MNRKFRWIDLALLPFGLCVLFLLLLGKLLGLTYKQISVIFNLWAQGAVLALSGLAPFGIAVYKLTEAFSMWWLVLSAVLLIYGIAYVYSFIKKIMVKILQQKAEKHNMAMSWKNSFCSFAFSTA